jgi:hypothetical protein
LDNLPGCRTAFFRLKAAVGFYAKQKAGEEKSRMLAIRSLYPFGGNR